MPDYRYAKLDPRLQAILDSLGDLMKLFHHLLLAYEGDPQRALAAMKQLQKMGYIDPGVDLEEFGEGLAEAKIIQPDASNRYTLTKKGERQVRARALEEIFTNLKRGEFGEHRTPQSGDGGEPLPETRPFAFGDDLDLVDLPRSVGNALGRNGGSWESARPGAFSEGDRIAGSGLRLLERDLEVRETEHHTTCATVLLVDISHSMVLYGEDRITPAKKVALALAELIRTRYPKDSLRVATFGDTAEEIRVEKIPYLGAGPYHTNTRAALQLARRILLRQKHPNKQVFLITDGKPSAVFEEGRLYVNAFGLDPKIVAMTLEEADVCRKSKIRITTFMLTDHPQLVDFVMKLTKINRGRAYLSSANDVARSVFIDYIRNRRKKFGG